VKNSSATLGYDSNPFTSISDAVAAAQSGDTLLLYPGRYDMTDLEINIPLTLRGVSGPGYTIFDGNFTSRAASIHAIGDVVFDGITFMQGSATKGSAIHATMGNVYLEDCIFENNQGSDSGSVHITGPASLTVQSSKFLSNSADNGAAITMDGAYLTATNTTFLENSATYYGGAVYLMSSTEVLAQGYFEDCVFEDNSADIGAGMFVWKGSATLINADLAYNYADRRGGAMGASSHSSIICTDCQIFANSANKGAAMYVIGNSSLGLEECDIYGNSQNAMYLSESTATLSKIELFNNYDSGSLASCIYGYDSLLYLHDSSIFSHALDFSPTIFLEESGATISDSTFAGNLADAGGAMVLLNCEQRKNGGVQINASSFTNNTAFTSSGGALYAENSALRISNSWFSQNYAGEHGGAMYIYSALDSFETLFEMYNSSVVRNSAGEYGGGIHADEVGELLIEGSLFSNNSAGDQGGSLWAIESNLHIGDSGFISSRSHGYAGGVGIDFGSVAKFFGVVIWDCEGRLGGGLAAIGGSEFRMVRSAIIGNSALQGGGMTVEAFSIPVIQGTYFADNVAQEDGGAVYVARIEPDAPADPILDNCAFDNNTAAEGIGGHIYLALADNIALRNISGANSQAVAGAGISAMASEVVMEEVYIHGTSAQQGSALYLIHSEVLLHKSNFSHHFAKESGAVIYTFQTQINVTDSYFSDNEARRGGAMFLFDSKAWLNSTIFERNSAEDQGGAVALLETQHLWIEYCIFAENTAGSEGGAVILDRSGSVMEKSLFENNEAGVEGAAVYIVDGLEVDILSSVFEGNAPKFASSGSGCGGAISGFSTQSLLVNGSSFHANGVPQLPTWDRLVRTLAENSSVSLNNGGAICLECTHAEIAGNTFVDNWGYMGGAVYSGEECNAEDDDISNSRRLDSISFRWNSGMRSYHRDRNASDEVTLRNCTFENNTATGGGGAVYWLDLPPALLSGNNFLKNRALYGPTVAGPPAYIIPQHNGIQEKSGFFFRAPITVHAKDVYNQTVKTENAASCFAQLNSGELLWKENDPFFPTPNLQGDTLEEFVMGVATFDEMIVEKYPDTTVNITFTAPAIVGNEAWVPLYLRHCVRGEVLPEGSGTCFRCEPGSFSWDLNGTRCMDCPTGAVCYGGDHIKALQNYWRFVDSPGSYANGLYTIHLCTNLDACIGDVLLSTSADVSGYFVTFGEEVDLTAIYYFDDCVDDSGSYKNCYINIEGETLRLADTTDAVQEQSIQLYYNTSTTYTNKEVYLVQEEGCSEGYAGNRCNNCAQGYGRTTGTKCGKCTGGKDWSIGFMILGICAVIIGSGIMIKSQLEEDEVEDKLSIFMKIFSSYMQLVSLFKAMSLSWPMILLYLFKAQNAMSSAGDAILSTDCAMNYSNAGVSLFYQKLAFYMMVPPVIVLACSGFWWVAYQWKCFRLKQKPWDFQSCGLNEIADSNEVRADQVKDILVALGEDSSPQRVEEISAILHLNEGPAPLDTLDEAFLDAYRVICRNNCIVSIIVLLFVVHPNISQYSFEVFACHEFEDGKVYLLPDNDISCATSSYNQWAFFVGLPGILLYALGIPILAFFGLHQVKDHLDLMSNQLKFGFLYVGYSRKYYWWEVWVTIRKLAIVFVTVFVHQVGPITEATSGIIVLGITLASHLHCQPYETKDLNDMETASLYVSILTLSSGLYFYSGEIDSGSWIFFLIFILVLNLGFCLYFLAVTWNEWMAYFWDTLREVPVLGKYVPDPPKDDESAIQLTVPSATGHGNVPRLVIDENISSKLNHIWS